MTINILLFYQALSPKKRQCLIVLMSLLFLSFTETQNLMQAIEQTRIIEKKHTAATTTLRKQMQLIQQTNSLLRNKQKSSQAMQPSECENQLINQARKAQIFTVQLTHHNTRQSTLQGKATWDAWQNFFNGLSGIQSYLKLNSLSLTRDAETNDYTVIMTFEFSAAQSSIIKNNAPSNTVTPPEIEWLGILAQGTQYWAFLKQPDQTLLGLTLNEYLPTTHWKIIALKPTQIILENDLSHEHLTQELN